jgi:hypothetical protein
MLVLLTEWILKYANEMGSGAMIYIPLFIKIGSGIQHLLGAIHIDNENEKICKESVLKSK